MDIQQLLISTGLLITKRYNDKMNEFFNYNDYYLKPMFYDKQKELYDLLSHELVSECQIYVYNSSKEYITITVTKDTLMPILQAVISVALPLQMKYQAYLAELTTMSMSTDVDKTKTRLEEIISNNNF